MFSKILVPLDHSLFAEQALGSALALAHATRAHIELALVHQHPALANLRRSSWYEEQVQSETRYLELVAHDLRSGQAVSVSTAVLEGDVVEALADHARRISADAIVMTSHGRTGFDRARLGSIADGLVRRTALPVLIVRPHETRIDWRASDATFRHVLVPLDGSAIAAEAVPLARALAVACPAAVTLCRVVQPIPLLTTYTALSLASSSMGMSPVYPVTTEDAPATDDLRVTARRELEAIAAALREQGVANVNVEVVEHENVAQAILDLCASSRADVIAMCTHGRGVSRWFLGSVTDEIVRCTDIPIVLCKTAHASGVSLGGSLEHASALAPIQPA